VAILGLFGPFVPRQSCAVSQSALQKEARKRKGVPVWCLANVLKHARLKWEFGSGDLNRDR